VAGLGIEVAKNVILAGVKSVTLFDPAPVAYPDLAAQFYLSEADLGKPRDQASAPRLAELNPYVPVHVLEPEGGEALTAEAVKRYQVLCVTNRPLAEQLRLNAITHPLVRSCLHVIWLFVVGGALALCVWILLFARGIWGPSDRRSESVLDAAPSLHPSIPPFLPSPLPLSEHRLHRQRDQGTVWERVL
jgi:hypothetical protein